MTAVEALAEQLRVRLARDDLLTHAQAAELLGVTEAHVRATRDKLAAMGARYVLLPSKGEEASDRGNWRWSRRSLLELARPAEEQGL